MPQLTIKKGEEKMNKKILLSSILALLIVIPLFCVYGSFAAAANATITTSVDTTPTAIGQTFVASVNIAGVQDLWAWSMSVTWDPSVLSVTKVTKGPFLTSNGDSDIFPPVTIDNVNGIIKGGPAQTLLSPTGVSGDGVLVKITFSVVGSGVSNVNLNSISLLDPTTPNHLSLAFTQGPVLTITIAGSNPTPTPTPTTTATPTPTPNSGSTIHVSTNQNGYLPGDLVQVTANVKYNGAAVASKDVVFTIRMQNNTDIATISNRTDSNGIATISFRIPKPEPDATIIFGNWSVLASVEVAQVRLTDTASFSVGYSITILKITAPSSVQRLGYIPINVTLQNSGNLPQGLTLTVSIVDSAQVPLGTIAMTINTQTQGTISLTSNLLIPAWAFTGQATIYANVLTTTPDQGGTPISPQATAQFQIA